MIVMQIKNLYHKAGTWARHTNALMSKASICQSGRVRQVRGDGGIAHLFHRMGEFLMKCLRGLQDRFTYSLI